VSNLSPNLIKRITAGTFLIFAVLALLFYAPTNIFLLVFGLVFSIGMAEWSGFAGKSGFLAKTISFFTFFSATYYMSATTNIITPYIFVAFYMFVIPLFFLLAKSAGKLLHNRSKLIWFVGFVYLLVPFYALKVSTVRFAEDVSMGRVLLCLLFVLIWSADSFAYFFGRKFGKHKLAPSVSPGKTVEGFFGGLVCTLLISSFFYLFYLSKHLDMPSTTGVVAWLIFTTLVVTLSVVGDLFESIFKRIANLKDSGNIIPGHGGILDRFDSLFMSLPLYALILTL
jgi:phosphatidate cytidylyltransferase